MQHFKYNMWLQVVLCFVTCNTEAAAAAKDLPRGIRFLAASMKYNPTHVHNATAYIVNGSLNLDMYTLKNMVRGFNTQMDLQISISSTKRYQTLFSYEFDLCEVLNNLFRTRLMQKWMKNMLKFSNFKENCPIDAGHYFVRDFVMEPKNIPAYLRPGDYRVMTYHFYGKRHTKKELMTLQLSTDFNVF